MLAPSVQKLCLMIVPDSPKAAHKLSQSKHQFIGLNTRTQEIMEVGGRMERSNSLKIKAVILDYGEVLCYPPTAEEWGRMAGVFNVDAREFRQLWGRNRLAYDRGDISYEAYWSKLVEEARVKMDPQQLQQVGRWDLEMWGHVNPTMVEWVEQIRPLVKQGREFKDAIAEVFAANAQLLALWRQQSTKKRHKKA